MALLRGPLGTRLILVAAMIIGGFLTLIWIWDVPTGIALPLPHGTESISLPESKTPESVSPPESATASSPSKPGSGLSETETVESITIVESVFGEEANTTWGWQKPPGDCPEYTSYARSAHEPKSKGKLALGFQRPAPKCRTFRSKLVEAQIARMEKTIADPDLFRLFENTFPSTLDTCIKWMGVAEDNAEEELAFIVTGDIDAMWLRDSANQLQVYRDLIKSPTDDLAAVFRGAINLQARYIIKAPYCNAFQAPPESGIQVGRGGSGSTVFPMFDPKIVSTCNFELDSFGAFLQLSADYLHATGDMEFFGKFHWLEAVETMIKTATAMMASTYDDHGKPRTPPYKFNSETTTMTGTLNNVGTGNPVAFTGMVRSPFRPSDDTSVFEFLVPANMMFSRYLQVTANITQHTPNARVGLSAEMTSLAKGIRDAINKHAVVEGPNGVGRIYAYEVDGFGGRNFMDDANVPSLLSAPFLGFVDNKDEVYLNTRKFVLSKQNPWYCEGPVINGVGGPHIKPGAAWPMSNTIQIMTSDNHTEIEKALLELLTSTNSIGLIHESVNSYSQRDFTRPWFSWANGLFGQTILDLNKRAPALLKKSYQDIVGGDISSPPVAMPVSVAN
ncbi:hypothetical protein TD95_004396 [Thielaviopsis punctulata]|uniref:Glycoside hydrolase family 125 protein n=1 Tax=Thielaviopsis punctulata TaxID=72032 RepID=A0A0F4ZHB6_9PEZI|nr:hypothetical protein TD95_004396 [Thielaviopsis punctulata]